MRRWLIVLITVIGVALAAQAKSKSKKGEVPKLFCTSQYVYVETPQGDPENSDVVPQDRDAAAALEDQLQDWHRYRLVIRREDADLVFVVRTGRIATVQPDARSWPQQGQQNSVTIGSRSGPAPGGTPNLGTNGEDPGDRDPAVTGPAMGVGSGQDMLTVFMGPQGGTPITAPLWRKSQKNGLQDPNMPLFQAIRSAVDASCSSAAPPSH